MIDGIRSRRAGSDLQSNPQQNTSEASTPPAADQFRPPQDVATDEEQLADASASAYEKDSVVVGSKPPFFKRLSKKQWIIIALVVLLLGGGAAAYLLVFHKKPAAKAGYTVAKGKPAAVAPTTEASCLTGLQVPIGTNKKPTTAIMIENSTDARPQSGLDQAGVVFEAVAEGGITRFVSIFQDSYPDYIGPVRSVRPYYIQWLMGFDASVAHVGGSPEAIQDLKTWGVKDLDQFYNSAYYHRISSRFAPHNVYTSMTELNDMESKKNTPAPKYTCFPRAAEAPSKTPNARTIDFTISSSVFNVHYDYDAPTNSYLRSEGGAAHMELHKDGSQHQITPKAVVALVMQQGIEADDLHTSYNTIGSGKAYVFQNGTVASATWQKSNNADQLALTDDSGKAIKLIPGQVWFTAVNGADKVSYKP
jgi:hypothetical protein